MLLTVLGVIIVTFLLFNVVGGSPATTVLGDKVSPRMLEDFESQRGYNHPLFLGSWARTRALADSDFSRNSGAWSQAGGAAYVPPTDEEPGHLRVPPGAAAQVPLSFPLDPASAYRLSITFRTAAAAEAVRGETVGILPPSDPVRFISRDLDFPAGGDALLIRTGDEPLDLSEVRLRRKLPTPFASQFLLYFRQLASFDFGTSHFTKQKISTMLKDGLVPSLLLTVPVLLTGLVISVCLSLLCAFLRDSALDRVLVIMSVALMSVNYLVWIVVGQYLLSYKLGWFPIWGFESWVYLLLPVGIGVVSGLGHDLRLYRTIMLDEMYKDYVRTAFAKGVSQSGVLFRHVLKNALIPIVTNVSLVLPFLYTGSLLLEGYFGIPGLGYMGINGVFTSDFDVVRAIVLIGSILYVLSNLLADLAYAFLDPRVRLR